MQVACNSNKNKFNNNKSIQCINPIDLTLKINQRGDIRRAFGVQLRPFPAFQAPSEDKVSAAEIANVFVASYDENPTRRRGWRSGGDCERELKIWGLKGRIGGEVSSRPVKTLERMTWQRWGGGGAEEEDEVGVGVVDAGVDEGLEKRHAGVGFG